MIVGLSRVATRLKRDCRVGWGSQCGMGGGGVEVGG